MKRGKINGQPYVYENKRIHGKILTSYTGKERKTRLTLAGIAALIFLIACFLFYGIFTGNTIFDQGLIFPQDGENIIVNSDTLPPEQRESLDAFRDVQTSGTISGQTSSSVISTVTGSGGVSTGDLTGALGDVSSALGDASAKLDKLNEFARRSGSSAISRKAQEAEEIVKGIQNDKEKIEGILEDIERINTLEGIEKIKAKRQLILKSSKDYDLIKAKASPVVVINERTNPSRGILNPGNLEEEETFEVTYTQGKTSSRGYSVEWNILVNIFEDAKSTDPIRIDLLHQNILAADILDFGKGKVELIGGRQSTLSKILDFVPGRERAKPYLLISDYLPGERYEITYTTGSPKVNVEVKENSLKVNVDSDQDYKNVVVEVELPKDFPKEADSYRVYWKEGQRFLKRDEINVYLESEDHAFLQFLVEHLSEQNFEVFLRSDAEHFDSEGNYLGNVYTEISQLDNLWSGKIDDSEYINIKFDGNLDKSSSIAMFLRVSDGKPYIQLYGSSNLIGTLDEFSKDDYSVISLENLVGKTDNLRIVVKNGAVEFDHINALSKDEEINPTGIIVEPPEEIIGSVSNLDLIQKSPDELENVYLDVISKECNFACEEVGECKVPSINIKDVFRGELTKPETGYKRQLCSSLCSEEALLTIQQYKKGLTLTQISELIEKYHSKFEDLIECSPDEVIINVEAKEGISLSPSPDGILVEKKEQVIQLYSQEDENVLGRINLAEGDSDISFSQIPSEVFLSPIDSACFDGVKDYNEEGIDCGGDCKECTDWKKKGVPWVLWTSLAILITCFVVYQNIALRIDFNNKFRRGQRALAEKDFKKAIDKYSELRSIYPHLNNKTQKKYEKELSRFLDHFRESLHKRNVPIKISKIKDSLPIIEINRHIPGLKDSEIGDMFRLKKFIQDAFVAAEKGDKKTEQANKEMARKIYEGLNKKDKEYVKRKYSKFFD